MLVLESQALVGNPLGDPHQREVAVYLPPEAKQRALPVIYFLAGFTGRGQKYLETHPWKPGVAQLYDRKLQAQEARAAILVFPDCFTKLGGSQYVNSSAVGAYEDHFVNELVPFIDKHLPTLAGRRAIAGKSSGGFGALHLCMRHPGLFQACASISGDCHFEYSLGSEFLAALRGLVPYDMQPARFLEGFYANPVLRGDAHAVLNVLAMAACYSPNPNSELGFDLPFDLETGERIQSVWDRWLAFDPVVACESGAQGLRDLELLHLECGLADEFHLQWGLRILTRKLSRLGIEHEHVEHEGGHMSIDHRVLEVLPKLARALGE